MADTTSEPVTADPLAAYLAEVRERSDHPLAPGALPISNAAVRGLMESAGDVPRLLKAVEAGLARHKGVPSVRLEPREEHKRWRGALVGLPEDGQEFETENLRVRRACPACQVFDEPYCGTCVGDEGRWQDWPCAEYRDITTALLREVPDGI